MKNQFGKGINTILGIRRKNGKKVSEVQSIRFDKSVFTPAQAKEWLKNHDFKASSFERATGAKKSVSKCYDSEMPSTAYARFRVEDGKVHLKGFDINLKPEDITDDLMSQFSQLGTSLPKKQPAAAQKSVPEESFNIDMRILRKSKKEQIVFGVVMEPEVPDGEDEITSAVEIEKAAHDYLKNQRVVKREHKDSTDCVPVESFIAPVDFTMKKEKVLKGSWLMGVHIPDAKLWKQVEDGKLNAFSVGGSAERIAA
jgi:hypothetical protein